MAQLLRNLPNGAKVIVPGGDYYGKPVVFEKLAYNHYGNNTTTLLTERIISIKAFSAKEPRNTDSNRRTNGNNNWEVSNIRQWLNSDGASWYSSTHQYSEPPTAANLWEGHNPYNTEKGFLANFPADFVQAIVPLETQYAKASVDGGGLGKTTDKVRLLSRAEVGLGAEGSVTDGKAFPKFTNDSSRIAKPTAEAVTNSSYKTSGLNANAGWYYWLRTANADYSLNVRIVDTGGTLNNGYAYNGDCGLRPALDLSANMLVTDSPNAQGQYEIVLNQPPTITLTEEDGRTLYENDTLQLTGQATDVDANDVVTVKAQVDAGAIRTLVAQVSDGSTPIPYSKQWQFKGGKLYEGTVAVSTDLSESTPHQLKVWAEDGTGNKSAVQTRTFNVILNRPPTVRLDDMQPVKDLIDGESFALTGTVSDPDGNNVTVSSRLRDGQFQQIYTGSPSTFSFNVKVDDLVDGDNALTILAEDSYGFKAQVTYNLKRTFDGQELDKAVLRYVLNPKQIAMLGAIVWIERQKEADIEVFISMTAEGEPEDFKPMNLEHTVDLDSKTSEDEFDYIGQTGLKQVAIKVRANSGTLSKISGAFQADGGS